MKSKLVLGLMLAVAGTLALVLPALAQSPGSDEELGGLLASTDEALYALVMPMVLVWILAAVFKSSLDSLIKQAISFVVYAAAAAGWLFYQDQALFAWDGLPRLFLLIAVVGQSYYRLYSTGVTEVTQRFGLKG